GFRRKKSCNMALFEFISCINKHRIAKRKISVLSLDIQRAFESVPHDRLVLKMKAMGLPLYLVSWIQRFLLHRKFFVSSAFYQSEFYVQSIGVPHGSVLSPLLYLIYTFDIPVSAFIHIFLYADDMLLVAADQLEVLVERRLSEFLSSLMQWANDNSLVFNA